MGLTTNARSGMSKILIISPVASHPNCTGNSQRIAAMAHALRKQGNDVYFLYQPFTVSRPPKATVDYWQDHFIDGQAFAQNSEIRFETANEQTTGSLKNLPLDALYPGHMDDLLRRLQSQHSFDAVLAEYVFFSRAFEQFPRRTVCVIDTHDRLTDRYKILENLSYGSATDRPPWPWRQLSLSREDEARGLRRADVVIAIQREELAYFQSLGVTQAVEVGHLVERVEFPSQRPTQDRLLFVGSGWQPNVDGARWFVEEVLPKVLQARPSVRLYVAGYVCKHLRAGHSVVLEGLTDDIAACYRDADVVINPVRQGTGQAIKSIEALSYGRPLVTTSQGVRGFSDGECDGIVMANDPDAFAAAIVRLQEKPDEWLQRAQAAADYMSRVNRENLDRLAEAFSCKKDADCRAGTGVETFENADKPIPSDNSEARVTVAICLHRRHRHLQELLAALASQEKPPRFDVLLVLNDSDNDTAMKAAELSSLQPYSCRIIKEPKQGLSNARNKAIESCSAHWLAFLDDDAIPHPTWLANLCGEAERVGAKAAGGKVLLRWDFPKPAWWHSVCDKWLSAVDLGPDTRPIKDKEWIVGASTIYDMGIFRIGLRFETRLGRKGTDLISDEESLLHKMVQEAGSPIYYIGSAIADHIVQPERATAEWLAERAFAQGRSFRIRHRVQTDEQALVAETERRTGAFWSFITNFANYSPANSHKWHEEFALPAGYVFENSRDQDSSHCDKQPDKASGELALLAEAWGRKQFEFFFSKQIAGLHGISRVAIVGGGITGKWVLDLCRKSGVHVVAMLDDYVNDRLTELPVVPINHISRIGVDMVILATLRNERLLGELLRKAGYHGAVMTQNGVSTEGDSAATPWKDGATVVVASRSGTTGITRETLHRFDFGLNELAIAGSKTVGIVGLNNLTMPLLDYCADLGYAIVAVFDDSPNGTGSLNGIPILPIPDIRTVKPDGVVLATLTERGRMKAEVAKLRGPIYRGIIVVAEGNDTKDYLRFRFKPNSDLARLHNAHAGQPAVIVGNGPSLLKTDPRSLKNVVTLACNSIFLMEGFEPTYYVVEDSLVAEDRASIINSLPWTKLFPKDLAKFLGNGMFFNNEPVQWLNFFSEDLSLGMETGSTVTYTVLQIAYYLGCDPVYLIGVDHNYVVNNSEIERNSVVFTSKTDDRNHFHPAYFGKGLRWHDPRVDRMEAVYRLARRAYERNGRNVFNATEGGRLEVFERISFSSIGNKRIPLHTTQRKPLQTTPMPRCSASAKKSPISDGKRYPSESVATTREASLVARLALKRFQNFRSMYPRIALYGAGAHTRWLLDLLDNNHLYPDRISRIVAVLDDKADGNQLLHGIPVIRPSLFKGGKLDAIVLSTDCHQAAMRAQLKGIKEVSTAPVVDIYEGLVGPFEKSSVTTPTGKNNDV